MPQMTREEFINMLKYNGWIYSDQRFNESLDILTKSKYKIYINKDNQLYSHEVSLIDETITGELIYDLIFKIPNIELFMETCIKYFDLKPIPKIETIEDYIKANFTLKNDSALEEHECSFYKFKHYEIRLDTHTIIFATADEWLGQIPYRRGKSNLKHQIKILNAFLDRDPLIN